MWQIIKNELTYNKILNGLVVGLFFIMLVFGVIDGKFAGEQGSNIRMFEMCALFAYLTGLYTKKRPQREAFKRLLPITENHTAIAEILITPLLYIVMISFCLLAIFISQGTISYNEWIRAFSDFSLITILMTVSSINGDLVTYTNLKFWNLKAKYLIFPGVVIYFILVLILTNLYLMDSVRELRSVIGAGYYPLLLFATTIPLIYLRIIVYKNREQHTKSFFISLMK